MIRTTLSLLAALSTLAAFSGSGGPDQYGYTWEDSNEPGGPVYNWVDITSTGTQVMGLADDNVIGPIVMGTNFPYYWYSPKKIWIGSNGYVAFNSVNLASPFAMIPQAGGGNDFIAGMLSDLNFTGVGNPGECWIYDDPTTTIISFINVPFWSAAAPTYTGSNTFQIIMERSDSTITVQYESQTGTTQNNDVTIGIESITGDIGLQHSKNMLPVANYAIRYYNPPNPLLQVTDAAIGWNTDVTSGGRMLPRNGASFGMTTNIRNTGSVDLSNFNTQGQIVNGAGQVQVTGMQNIGSLLTNTDTTITYGNTFSPTQAGTYSFNTTLSGIANELVTSNNALRQELVVYDTNTVSYILDWVGPTDDGLGLGWNGGNGGVGVYIVPPSYPSFITASQIRIASNTGAACYIRVYDDDGVNGTPGTLLDSVFIDVASATAGDHQFPLNTPFTLTSGGVYVQWYMDGAGINIARDIAPPFSLRTYEVLSGVWAEYRDRETEDFHLGLVVSQVPIADAGCTGYFGLIDGATISQPTAVRTYVRNYGNQSITGFPVSYQFSSDPVVTETYSGAAILPGDSVLYQFNQLLQPSATASGQICAWSQLPADVAAVNDTVCINISIITGVEEFGLADVRIGPDPVSELLHFNGLPAEMQWELLVMTSAGKQVLMIQLDPSNAALDVRQMAEGLYLYELRTEGAAQRGKFVVQRNR